MGKYSFLLAEHIKVDGGTNIRLGNEYLQIFDPRKNKYFFTIERIFGGGGEQIFIDSWHVKSMENYEVGKTFKIPNFKS